MTHIGPGLVFGVVLLVVAPGVAQETERGSLQVRCIAGYQIYVDGKLAGICTSQAEGFLVTNLRAGDHKIGVRRSGYMPGQFVITVQPGSTTELKASALKLRRRIKYRPQEEPVDMTVESPPMFADDTATPGERNIELNLSFGGDLSLDRKIYEVPRLDFNYGIGENLQLKYEMPWEIQRAVQTDASGDERHLSAHGFSDSTIGVKFRFYDDEQTHLSFAVYPQVEFKTPGSKTESNGGVAKGGTTWFLPILLTKEFDRLAVTGNAGVEKSTEQRASLSSDIGLGTRLSPRLALLGEVVGQNLNNADLRRLILNFGLRRKLDDHQAVGTAVGHDISAGDGQKHTYIRVAYQRSFGQN